MGGKNIKVKDRRMFTEAGELREEYRFLDDVSSESRSSDPTESQMEGQVEAPPRAADGPNPRAADGPNPRAADGPNPPAADGPNPPAADGPNPPAADGPDPPAKPEAAAPPAKDPPRVDVSEESAAAGPPEREPSSQRAPGFMDLIMLLAEPIPLFLGDAKLPDGRSAESYEMARLHIDLLDVLRQKTSGNLTAQESAVLEDVLYRTRIRYVEKKG